MPDQYEQGKLFDPPGETDQAAADKVREALNDARIKRPTFDNTGPPVIPPNPQRRAEAKTFTDPMRANLEKSKAERPPIDINTPEPKYKKTG